MALQYIVLHQLVNGFSSSNFPSGINCTILGIASPADDIEHSVSAEWLQSKAKLVAQETINPIKSSDPVYSKHRAFLHLAFLYIDLRRAIQWEDGPQILRHWKLWIPRFIGTGCKNYATEAVNLIAHINADFPKHTAYIATHNRTDPCDEVCSEAMDHKLVTHIEYLDGFVHLFPTDKLPHVAQ